ncbi:hypothetical protein [Amaricoccus sp.]|uniref:hypothetical protein n=1 Tax=Amaricoccus sp. TaxID=1872485 RepID=UPI001B41E06D|nr:hypothetical protein [Amaricoccus sp.]MBP7003472.1 hypothetical protein [Amaricoccus sp.]
MERSFRHGVAGLALAATLALPGMAAAEAYRGKAAQALRCAAYVGMTAHLMREAGEISRTDYDTLQDFAVHLLMEWVPSDDPMPAYRAALDELSTSGETYRRFVRHADYCIATFG